MQPVLGALSEAVELGVVTEEPGTIGLYRFSHPLMREVVYWSDLAVVLRDLGELRAEDPNQPSGR